jgi:hypothetical protein
MLLKAPHVASYSMVFIPSFMAIGSGFRVILKLLPQRYVKCKMLKIIGLQKNYEVCTRRL